MCIDSLEKTYKNVSFVAAAQKGFFTLRSFRKRSGNGPFTVIILRSYSPAPSSCPPWYFFFFQNEALWEITLTLQPRGCAVAFSQKRRNKWERKCPHIFPFQRRQPATLSFWGSGEEKRIYKGFFLSPFLWEIVRPCFDFFRVYCFLPLDGAATKQQQQFWRASANP